MRRNILIRCVFVAMLLLGTASAFAQERVVTVWVNGQPRYEEYQAVIQLFEERYPNIKVELILIAGTQAQFMERILLAITAGSPPDVAGFVASEIVAFAARGLLLDVTDALEGYTFTPGDTLEATWRGRMYGAPYHASSRGLFKRVDIFEQAGLDPNVDPASLEELEQWSTRLTIRQGDGTYSRIGFVPWGSNWGLPAWMWAFGGELVVERDGKMYPTANDPRNIEALEWIRSQAALYGYNFNPVPIGLVGFQQGAVAMDTNSSTVVGTLLAEGVPFTTGRVPYPPGGRNGIWGGGQALAIPINARNIEDAILLMQFFSEAEVQIKRFEAYPEALPANWDALSEVVRTLPPQYAVLIEQLPEARPRTPLWVEYYTQQLRPAERAVVEGRSTPVEALERVQQVMENLFADLFE